MLGIALALAASVSWGTSDFIGGLLTRRFSALSVLLVSQPIGLALAIGVALVFGAEGLTAGQFALAALGGATVVAALGAYYKAMALGSISIVATIGALGVLVPVIGGFVLGEVPAPVQTAGAAIAIVAMLLVAREPDPEWRAANRRSVGLAALAALGFGVFLFLVGTVSKHDAAWTIAAARVGGVGLLVIAGLWLRPGFANPRGRDRVALLSAGVFDVTANSLYAVSANYGLLPLVAVAGSMYSAVTILLARFVLGERLARPQQAGVVIALIGIGMIAAGS